MARPKKKPQYNSETIMKELIAAVVELYLDSGENVSIRQIADEFGMTPLKIRKILITAGVFSSDVCDQVLELFRSGKSVPEIQRITGLSNERSEFFCMTHNLQQLTNNLHQREDR